MDTIFAEATAPGKAGVSIIRVSGPQAFTACRALASVVPEPNRASLRILRDAEGRTLDEALVLTFRAGASFTGEDVVEFQTHGSRAVVAAVCDALGQITGTRLARPGEFTRRALENDRLDLVQVEGLADLINAETELQRRLAQRIFSGESSAKILFLRDKVIRAGALIEATIDFVDEDVPVDVMPEVLSLIGEVDDFLRSEISGFGATERLREGFEVAIVGPPNSGKSTLLNTIAQRDAALTSSIAGTTRDIVEVRCDLDGLPVTFLDTAGLRTTDDTLEAAGIERAIRRATSADLRIFLLDRSGDLDLDRRPDDLIVQGKADLSGGDISGLTGFGIAEMLDRITAILKERLIGASSTGHRRQLSALKDARGFLSYAQSAIHQELDSELVAVELRHAANALQAVVGRVDVDDLLGEIFANFCIGK